MNDTAYLPPLEYAARYAVLTERASARADVLHVDDSWPVFQGGEIIHAPRTGENMLVGSVTPHQLRVTRGLQTEAFPLRKGDEILMIGLSR